MNNELKKVNWIFVDDSSSIVYKGFLCPDSNNILIDEDTFKIVFKDLFDNRINNNTFVLEEEEVESINYIIDNKVYNDSLKTFLYTLDGYSMEIVTVYNSCCDDPRKLFDVDGEEWEFCGNCLESIGVGINERKNNNKKEGSK